jgi:opacity protein-like surface antigen
MKKLFGIASLAAMMAALAYAPAQAQNYIEGGAGITTQDELDWNSSTYDVDQGWNANFAVGQQMWGNWDVEGELSYDKMEYSCCNPNNTNEYRLMVNATRNFSLGGFTPYAGAGIGAAWVNYENSSGYEYKATEAAYQIIGGVRVPLGDNWSLFGEYRYHDLFSEAAGDGGEWEHSGHDLTFGARMNLN